MQAGPFVPAPLENSEDNSCKSSVDLQSDPGLKPKIALSRSVGILWGQVFKTVTNFEQVYTLPKRVSARFTSTLSKGQQ